MRLKALEDRVTKLENFITERLDEIIDDKVLSSETYLEEKIQDLDGRLDSEIDELRSEIPDYDLDDCISDLAMRIEDLEG